MIDLNIPPPRFTSDGEFGVYLNPSGGTPFGVVDFGPETYMYVSEDDAARLMSAFAKVLAFAVAYRQPHAFEPGDRGYCTWCGAVAAAPPHTGTAQAETAP